MDDDRQHKAIHDPLREGLVILARQLGKVVSAEQLGQMVALEHERLSLTQVTRAMYCVDIHAQVLTRPLEQIPQRLLPLLLLCRDGSAAVLVGKREDVVLVSEACGVTELALSTLVQRYAGVAIAARRIRFQHLLAARKKSGTYAFNEVFKTRCGIGWLRYLRL